MIDYKNYKNRPVEDYSKKYDTYTDAELNYLLENPIRIKTRVGCDCESCLEYEVKLINSALDKL